jgi:Acyltransferase family
MACAAEPGSVAGEAGPVRGSAPDARGSSAEPWGSGRLAYVDNLKVLLIAAIIAAHAVLGYAATTDAWSWSDVREVTLSAATESVLLLAFVLTAVVIPLLFLVAGLLTPRSLERKGTATYVRDRLLRLGVPFVVVALLLWPLLEYALFRTLGDAPGLWTYLRAEGTLDTGVLWFVGALLIFSLVYAGWVHLRGRRPGPAGARPLRAGHLLALAAAVTVTTFLVRLVLPLEGDNPIVDLNLWEWPACIALFGLGVTASGLGWLTGVPDRLRRHCRTATLAAAMAIGALLVSSGALGIDEEQLTGGWRWPALVFAACESAIAVFGAVWLLGVAQRHLDRRLPLVGPAARRSAYGAFMLQGPVLLGFALALRPVPLPAEVKALLVGTAAVTGSFALAWLLIRRVPLITRVL